MLTTEQILDELIHIRSIMINYSEYLTDGEDEPAPEAKAVFNRAIDIMEDFMNAVDILEFKYSNT